MFPQLCFAVFAVLAYLDPNDPLILKGDYAIDEGSTPAHLPQLDDIEFEEMFPKGDIQEKTWYLLRLIPQEMRIKFGGVHFKM